ncbi:MAG: alkaline phosphatase [Dokdonella sp.]|uniref:alkaline phosphatase n=1 Tax=Dokdonella sp. TaxID=2291710 RepID=UPI0032644193
MHVLRRVKIALCAAVVFVSACATAPQPSGSRATTSINVPLIHHPDGETPAWWFLNGAAAAHTNAPVRAHAKNVIVFLGDGMSIPTIAAARILDGQRKGQSGEENRLSFENFPATALSRTYETDFQTADSAGTMTAIMSGVKTRAGVIGVDQTGARGNCEASRGHEVVSALELAAAAGQATGVVTTARITHATPAATYGHLPERNWEFDTEIPPKEHADGCIDFARQLVEFGIGGGIDVALGGGRTEFMTANQTDPEYAGHPGKRLDGRDLISEWQRQPGSAYVWNAKQLAAIDPSRMQHVLGLFEPEHMKYEVERPNDPAGEPSLSEMTRAALSVLQKNPKGYFLMVEGGRIDHGHHAGNAYRALTETIEFANAVQVANEMSSADDTLILVTADHSHTMTFAGYAARGNPILGKMRGSSGEGAPSTDLARDATGLSYTTLGYANGPGYAGASDRQPEGAKRYPHNPTAYSRAEHGRPNLEKVDTEAPDYEQEAMLPLSSETHGGDDVAVFARGPGSAAVHGSMEENALFHVIAQSDDAIRAQLCAIGACDVQGVPVNLPVRAKLLERAAAPNR